MKSKIKPIKINFGMKEIKIFKLKNQNRYSFQKMKKMNKQNN